MKKVFALFLALFFAALPLCFGIYEKTIFKGWAVAGRTLNIENQTYRVNYIKESNSTIIYFPDGLTLVIDASSSKCTREGIYSVCQTGQMFERNGIAVPPDIHNPDINISLYLQMNRTEVKLGVANDIPSSFIAGDTLEVLLTIENSAPVDITNINFVETFPNSFSIRSTRECIAKDSTLSWQGGLQAESKFSCIYYISPKKEGVFEIKTLASYVALEKILVDASNKSVIVEEHPFSINYTFAPANITLVAKEDFIIRSFTGIKNISAPLPLKKGAITKFFANESALKTTLEYSYKGNIRSAVFYFEKRNESLPAAQNTTKKPEYVTVSPKKTQAKESNSVSPWVFYSFLGVALAVVLGIFLSRKKPQKTKLDVEVEKIKEEDEKDRKISV